MHKNCSSFLSLATVVLLLPFFSARAQSAGSFVGLPELESRRVRLPNGWSLTPVGVGFPVGCLPLNISVYSSGKNSGVNNNGQNIQTHHMFYKRPERRVHTILIPKLWGGMAF